MPLMQFLRREPLFSAVIALLFAIWCFIPGHPKQVEAEPFSLVGAQAWHPWPASTPLEPRVSVLETDAWRHSLRDGRLYPVPQLPMPGSFWSSLWDGIRRAPTSTHLTPKAFFTPAAYLEQIEGLRNAYCRQRDILMYYGGVRYRPAPEGLNFNAWSGDDLRKLRALGSRPFIGLESMERPAIQAMAWRLKEAGYGPLDRIYVRIASEPSYSAYGTEDGTRKGKRCTPAAYAAYQKKFIQASAAINALNRKLGLNIHTVFAGASREDFARYSPPEWSFDAIGYDLYATPENKGETLRQLRELSKRYPSKPLVIPEFGIATERHARRLFRPEVRWADPQWASDTLADVLMILGRHPAGVGGITVFSVNVSGRRSDRRWSWAWTPQMFEMLKEWQAAPKRWQKQGFHAYDPLSYPVGRDVLFLNRPDTRIVYRKLAAFQAPGVPLFQETWFYRNERRGKLTSRIIYFDQTGKREVRRLMERWWD